MPLDTTSYYPEVPDPENREDNFSLNERKRTLFGDETSQIQDDSSEKELRKDNQELPPHRPDNLKRNKNAEESDWEKIISGISNFLSWTLIPLLMPVYGMILAFGLSVLDVVPGPMKVRFVLITAGINFVIPVLIFLLLKFMGVINDVGLNGRKERLIPYIVTILCFGSTAWFLAMRGAPIWFVMFYAGGATAALINLIVNFWWKISAHAAGIAGLIALLIRMEKDVAASPQLLFWLLLTILLTGLMGSARVWLGRHTVWQVLAGYAVGFCSVFFLMSIN